MKNVDFVESTTKIQNPSWVAFGVGTSISARGGRVTTNHSMMGNAEILRSVITSRLRINP